MGVKEGFQKFNRAMTAAEVATVLGVKARKIADAARRGDIPRVPGLGRLVRFDPEQMIALFCQDKPLRSLTTEKQSFRSEFQRPQSGPEAEFTLCL